MWLPLPTTFQAFTWVHLATLLLILLGVVVAVALGRAAVRRGRGAERRLASAIATAGLLVWALTQAYYILWVRDYTEAVPLHVCDLAGLLGPLALWFPRRPLRTLMYFWAFGLSIWGLLTPVIEDGPATLRFWLFWINHGLIMLYGGYDVVVRGYRPYAGDFGLAVLMTLGYLALVMPINLAMGWNYGYVGNVQHGAWTPLDLLPAWPWRITGVQVMGLLMLVNVWLPWEIVRWRQRARRRRRARLIDGRL